MIVMTSFLVWNVSEYISAMDRETAVKNYMDKLAEHKEKEEKYD